jgi:hypothetical protein
MFDFASSVPMKVCLTSDDQSYYPDTSFRRKGLLNTPTFYSAYRSLDGSLSCQSSDTVSQQLSDYGSFRKSFLSTWWSASQQSLVKCSLYQGKYNRQSNVTLSAHFLEYATMDSYLDPRPHVGRQFFVTVHHRILKTPKVISFKWRKTCGARRISGVQLHYKDMKDIKF